MYHAQRLTLFSFSLSLFLPLSLCVSPLQQTKSHSALWAFTLLPSPFFCTARDDICTCKGAGFDIFQPFCDARDKITKPGQNMSSANATNAVSTTVAEAKAEFAGFFVSLGPTLGVVALSVGVIALTLVIFVVFRILNMLNTANVKAEEARKAKEVLVKKNEKVSLEVGEGEGK